MSYSVYFNKDNLSKYPSNKPYNKTKLNSIVFQFCYNEVVKDKMALLPIYKTLMLFIGQKPMIIKAKESIAAFKLRKNMEIGAKVTIRQLNKINIIKLIILNLPKLNISKFNVSFKNFDFFYPNIYTKTATATGGASIYFNISTIGCKNKEIIKSSKNFYLSSLNLF